MSIIDLHNDALLELPEDQLPTYLRDAKDAGVTEILLSVWTTELHNPMAEIAEKAAIIKNLNADIPICRLHIEDAWFLTKDNIDAFIALRPYSVGLTWNGENNLAGGAESNGGLTEWGRTVIKRLEAANIQIDTAHLNRASFYQFAKVTTRPILCTHTAFDRVHRHRRNLTDRQIRAIIGSNGLVGLAFVPKFLGRAGIMKHISYFTEKFGAGHIALGTDFYGTAELPARLKDYKDIYDLDIKYKEEILHKNAYAFLHR
jgi:microsomal dipeptidase-like Zn-dependent dipeptidase